MRAHDPYKDYYKGMDFVLQQIQDRKDRAMFLRLRQTCYKATDAEIREFLIAARGIGLGRGMTTAEASTWGDEMIEKGLDMGLLIPNLDVKA